MRRHLDINGDYLASNPFMNRTKIKNWFMERSFLLYKKVRISLARWFPLKDWQQYMWSPDPLSGRFEADNSAKKCVAGESDPFFYIDHFFVLDLVPKEEWPSVVKGVERFQFKHADGSFFNRTDLHTDWFSSFNRGEGRCRIASFRIKKESVLSPYISHISFHAINLSSSFLCLKIAFSVNVELNNRLSRYCTQNVSNQLRITGFEGKRWYEFQQLSEEIYSGGKYKSEIFETVLKDIAWRVAKETRRFIPNLLITLKKKCPTYMCSVATNVDGNDNGGFWKSLDIDPRFCDYSQNLISCIAWRSNGNAPLFLFLNSKEYGDIIGISTESFHIADRLCYSLICEKISDYVEQKLSGFMKEIAKRNKRIRKWLKLKVRFDRELFYPVRFLEDIEAQEGAASHYIALPLSPKRSPIIAGINDRAFDSAHQTQILYTDLVKLFDSNIQYKSAKSNYSMQNKALAVSVMSLFVAISALAVTVFTSGAECVHMFIEWVVQLFR